MVVGISRGFGRIFLIKRCSSGRAATLSVGAVLYGKLWGAGGNEKVKVFWGVFGVSGGVRVKVGEE